MKTSSQLIKADKSASLDAETAGTISPQAEEYLEAICRITDRGGAATLTELSRELKIAPPSILGMLRRMKQQGLLSYQGRKGVTLLRRGRACAIRLRRHHRLAERLLTDLLNMPWERAHEIACRFEHVIDQEVEPYLLAALHYPATCPHGNAIDSRIDERWKPLTALNPGQTGRLRRVVDESSETLAYLSRMRLGIGRRVVVYSIAPYDGTLTVEIDGARHGLSRSIAGCLLVELEGKRHE